MIAPINHATQRRESRVRDYDRLRRTAAQRGYDTRWGRYREWFQGIWTFCGDRPECAPQTDDSECVRNGLNFVKANVLDHIIPVSGRDDPLFYRQDNHQSLCQHCHDVKRQRESMETRRSG